MPRTNGKRKLGGTMLPIEREMAEVMAFQPKENPVLTFYADLERSLGFDSKAQVEAALGGVLELHQEDDASQRGLSRAAELVVENVRELFPPPRAIAAFVCPDLEFIRVIPLPGPVGQVAHWGSEFDVVPLLSVIGEQEINLVAVVDSERGRLFRVFMSQIEEVGAKGAALTEGSTWHVRALADRILEAMTQMSRFAVDRLLIAGRNDDVDDLVQLLPRRIRDRTRLVSGITVDSVPAEVLGRVIETQQEAKREAEGELVDNLLDRYLGRSVFGVQAVAVSVWNTAVHTLVLGRGASAEGVECTSCGWFSPDAAVDSCSRCASAVRRVPDLVRGMAARVIAVGGRVEEIRAPGPLKTLRRFGGFAALLRSSP